MQKPSTDSQTTDDYIAGFPEPIRERLAALRETIRAAAPESTERFAYGMPTFAQHGNLVHFAVFREHIGFYPTPSGIEAFAAELTAYGTSKGAVRFPLDQPLPLDLVDRIVRWRVAENLAKGSRKRKPSTEATAQEERNDR